MAVPFLLYVILCLIAAVLGRRTRLGFLGTLCIAFISTPIWVFAALVLFNRPDNPDKPDDDREKARW